MSPSRLCGRLFRMPDQTSDRTLPQLQDTLGSASDKADHHTSKATKEGQSYLDSAKDQTSQLFGQTQVHFM